MPYSPQLWDTLFHRYMWDDVLSLANDCPNKLELVVPYDKLSVCFSAEGGLDAVDVFENHGDTVLVDGNTALHNLDIPADLGEEWSLTTVQISGFPTKNIRDIRYQDVNKFVAFTAMIMRKTDVRFSLVNAVFKCQRCGSPTAVLQEDGKFIEPFECSNDDCGRKGHFKLIREESTFINKRKIQLQESFEAVQNGEQTLSKLDAFIYGAGDVWCPPLGSLVNVSGILRGIQMVTGQGKTSEFIPRLDVNCIEALDSEHTIEITDEDKEVFEQLKKDPKIVDKLIKSIAPSVRGHDLVKEGCLCSAVSANNSMVMPDGKVFRGEIHIGLVGDPSVAKSTLMRGIQRVVPRALYAAGRSSSTKGLTVAVTKDSGGWGEGGWVAEAGMLVLADKALALIDDADKFEKEELQELNTPMESGVVPVHKAGINRDFYTRVPVIIGMNPKFGRFDRYEPLLKQIKIPPDTLSRLDLIFLLSDDINEKADKVIASYIAGLVTKATRIHKHGDFTNAKTVASAWDKDDYVPEISPEFMRKWIQEAKKIKVEISPECSVAVEGFFLSRRSQTKDSPDDTVPVVWRHLDGMFRLLMAQARLRHSGRTELQDFERVKSLVIEASKIITDPVTGKLDSDIINTGMSHSQREKMRKIRDALKEPKSLDEISEDTGMEKSEIVGYVSNLKTQGEIIELRHGVYKAV